MIISLSHPNKSWFVFSYSFCYITISSVDELRHFWLNIGRVTPNPTSRSNCNITN